MLSLTTSWETPYKIFSPLSTMPVLSFGVIIGFTSDYTGEWQVGDVVFRGNDLAIFNLRLQEWNSVTYDTYKVRPLEINEEFTMRRIS